MKEIDVVFLLLWLERNFASLTTLLVVVAGILAIGVAGFSVYVVGQPQRTGKKR